MRAACQMLAFFVILGQKSSGHTSEYGLGGMEILYSHQLNPAQHFNILH